MTRLEAAARIAQLIRVNIENNSGLYHGTMIPNLQSIVDLAHLPDEYLDLDTIESQIVVMEKRLGV